ncbi:MAG: hypothetical protein WC254_03585 [Candidatus Woesearchaeota archaeon]|jgi:hypothetical protein
MIGKSNWFQRRKYGGWGISPKTWQGWVYVAVIILPFIIFQALPFWNVSTRMYITLGWLIFLLLDVSHIMVTLKRDEREYKIEAISERNAAWVMVMVIVAGVLYETILSALDNSFTVDIFLIVALFAGMIAKTISNVIYEKRPL